MKDYTNRKFYSKVGRASNSNNKSHCVPYESHRINEITMEFILSELEKVKKENTIHKRRKRRSRGTSSFLTNTRENYMKPFVTTNQTPTSADSPMPGKYSPNVNFIKPSPSPVLKLRKEPKNTKSRLISLPTCIDRSVYECVYPNKRENSVLGVEVSEIETFFDKKKFVKSYSVKGKNLVLFEKQSPRKFLPVHSVADSRFELMDYFPKISSKVKRSPVCDFSTRIGREGSESRFGKSEYEGRSMKKLK